MLVALDPTLVGAISGTLAALILATATTVTTLLLRKADSKERAEVRKEVADATAEAKKSAEMIVEVNKETTEKLDKTLVQGEATHLFLNSQDTENKRRMLVLTESLLISLKENRASRQVGGLRAKPGVLNQIKVIEMDIEAQKKEIKERETQTKKADAKVEEVQ